MDNKPQQPLISGISEQAYLIPIDHRYDTLFPTLPEAIWGEKSWRYSGKYHDSIEGLVRFMATTYYNLKNKNFEKWWHSYQNSLDPGFFYNGLKPVDEPDIQALYKFEIAVVWNEKAKPIIKQYLENTRYLYRTEIVKTALAIQACMGEAATGLKVLSDHSRAELIYSIAADGPVVPPSNGTPATDGPVEPPSNDSQDLDSFNEDNQKTNKIKINNEVIDEFFKVVKFYFDEKVEKELHEKLLNFDKTGKKLLFLGSGNKLAFAFRQLIDDGLMIGSLAAIESWIRENFQYIDDKKKCPKDYTSEYLNKIISSNAGCQSPIMTISKEKNQFIIDFAPRKRKKYQID